MIVESTVDLGTQSIDNIDHRKFFGAGSRLAKIWQAIVSSFLDCLAYIQTGGFEMRFATKIIAAGITFLAFSGIGNAASANLYGLIQTSGFNELLDYDLTQDPFISGGYQSSSLAPLEFTNLLPQNSIIGIAVDQPVVSTSVPEPANWAMTILGLGLAGFGLRRQRSIASLVGTGTCRR